MKALVCYATKDGHTRVIAERIGERLAREGHTVHLENLADVPRDFGLQDHDVVVLGSPVRVGKHLSSMRSFARRHRDELQQRPSAFFSCSLTSAGGTEETRRTARELVDAFIDETGWRPDHVGIFAGALLYRRYNFIIRAVMKAISRRSGGDTDTSRNYDYTRWDEVDAFADDIAHHLMDAAPRRRDDPRPRTP
jgi:menaquinone-dependent protoporphyrinogen oxidase